MFGEINTRSIVFNLIMVNVVVFALTMMIGEKMYELFAIYYPFNPMFKPVQIVSHMFMHGGLSHIFFNMFALYMFGNVLERVWGPKRFLFFYFFTGLGAVFLHIAVQALIVYNFTGTIEPTLMQVQSEPGLYPTYFAPTVGASGAIFGILIGFAMLFPNTELMLLFFPVPIKAKYFVTLYVILELFLGLNVSDNVAHFAHLGGALFGFILVKYWSNNRTTLY